MNNIINTVSTDTTKTNSPTIASSTNAGLHSSDAIGAGDSSNSAGSFQETIKKTFDESKLSEEMMEKEPGGNNLPPVETLSELSAHDGRVLHESVSDATNDATSDTTSDTNILTIKTKGLATEVSDQLSSEKSQLLSSELKLNNSTVDESKLSSLSALSDSSSIQQSSARTAQSITQQAAQPLTTDAVVNANSEQKALTPQGPHLVKTDANVSNNIQNSIAGDISKTRLSTMDADSSISEQLDLSVNVQTTNAPSTGKQNLHDVIAQLQSKTALSTTMPSGLSSLAGDINNVTLEGINRLAPDLSSSLTTASHTSGLNPTAETVSVVSPLNVLTSQLRSYLQSKPDSLPKVPQVDVSKTSIGGVSNTSVDNLAVNTRIDLSMMQSAEMMSLEKTTLATEQFALTLDKNNTLANTALTNSLQQVIAPAAQTTSLLHAGSSHVVENLAGITNPTINSLSSINQQTMPQGVIAEAFGRAAWSQGMGKQVLSMVNQNIGSAEIRLNPAHLGPIEILIDMSDEQVSVSLSSRHAVVREAMEQALPKLREMLDENGFNLADADISKHSFAEQREQNAEKNANENGINKTNSAGNSNDPLITTDVNEKIIHQASLSSAKVDYYI